MKKKLCSTLAILLIFLGCAAETGEFTSPVSQIRTDLLGTVITITVYENAENGVIEQVFDCIANIEEKMTTKNDNSEVSLISKMAGIEDVAVSDETYHVIKKAKEISKSSKGAFDLSIGPLVKLWDIGGKNHVPSPHEISETKKLVDYNAITVNDEKRSIYLEKEGMSIDLGGIAKGYAGDAAKNILVESGIKSAILDLGGNVVALGHKPDGTDWKIGIKNPEIGNNSHIGIVEVSDKSIVTSGGYERFFVVDDITYHHILSPQTGYPLDNELLSATVICENSETADMLSTAVFVLGIEKGIPLLNEYNATGIFITKSRKVYITNEINGKFILKDLTYTITGDYP